MSDDEDYYDDDDYIYYDDGPYAEAVSQPTSSNLYLSFADQLQDDLAEHTMHSPVWIDYDPSLELEDAFDESELYPSDFFDEDVPEKRKRRSPENDNGSKIGISSKRRKLEATDAIPELSLGEPVTAVPKVVWRSSEHDPIAYPVLEDGQAEKVSLLKDWRERFKEPVQDSFFQMPRRTSQTMFAVVVERRRSQETDRQRMPPPTGTKNTGLNSRGKKPESKALANGTSGTASSLAKQRQKSASNTTGAANTPSARSTLAQKENPATSRGRKRKAREPNDPNSEDELANGDTRAPKKHDLPKSKTDPPPKATAPAAGRK